MKKLLMVGLAIVVLGSCSKTEDAAPNNPAQGPTPFTPGAGNSDGFFAAVKMKFAYTNDQIPIPIEIVSDIGTGGVYTSTGSNTFVDVGAVTLNSYNLDKQSNNSYLKAAFIGGTPSTLDLDNGANWSVAGANGVAGFSYNHTGSFPSFTGTLPNSLTRSSGITVPMTGLSGADSVYICVATTGKTIVKGFAGNSSSISLSAAELQDLPAVTDNTAYLEVIPVKFSTQSINSKQYVFIKEWASVTTVNIN